MEEEKNWPRVVLFVLEFRGRGLKRKVDVEVYGRVCMCLVCATVFLVERMRVHVGQRIFVILLKRWLWRRRTNSRVCGHLSHGPLSKQRIPHVSDLEGALRFFSATDLTAA